MRPRRVVFLGGGLLLAAATLAPAAEEARWSRQVEVSRPGQVVLELEGRVAARAELDLELIGPDGREVPFTLYEPASAARPVRVTRVLPSDAGWQVELDAGASPPRHDRLRFALAKEMAADDVLLEGGDDDGAWRELARGSLFRLGEGRNLQGFELAYEPTAVRRLRLSWPREAGLPELLETEILAAGDNEQPAAPAVRRRLGFEAQKAGAYRLIYGRLVPRERRVSAIRPPVPDSPATLGPELEGPAPAWPPAAEPGPALQGEFERSWPIETGAARGRLVALQLPGEVSRLTGPAPGSLRIDAGGAQLPFVSKEMPQPEKILAATLRPAPVPGKPGESRAEIRATGAGDRVELRLFASGPFEREVRFEGGRRRPRREGDQQVAPHGHWSCPASSANGCQLRVLLFPPPREAEGLDFFVEFTDGENPPLREVGAELWTERTVLYFVDPGRPLTLRWGSGQRDPAYDFAGLKDVLLHDEAVPARLGPEQPVERPAEAPRWVLPLVIGLAAMVLLAVLARLLRGE